MNALDWLVLLALAAASGCGIGGGGLLVVYLTILRGVPQKMAQAVNLLFFLASAGSSAAVQVFRGSFPKLGPVLMATAAALPGVLLGSALREAVSVGTLRTVFGVFLILAGLTAFLRSGKTNAEPENK